jgi:restriction system protein
MLAVIETSSVPATFADIPRYADLKGVRDLGGSASSREIIDRVLEDGHFSDELLAVKYPTREKSMLVDRVEWARSYCKLSGALESPARKLYLLSPLGHEIVEMTDEEAHRRLHDLDRLVRAARTRKPKESDDATEAAQAETDAGVGPLVGLSGLAALEEDDDSAWTEIILGRLHRLTPGGFEEFVMYTLRLFGLELTRRGGSGDEGIDGIGTAPMSEILSATVAVQVKRYDPTSTVGRETVALFQRDASAVGAERAVFVTLGRFSGPAKRAARSATPNVDLIDGERLCELLLTKQVGVKLTPVVDTTWFDRFD